MSKMSERLGKLKVEFVSDNYKGNKRVLKDIDFGSNEYDEATNKFLATLITPVANTEIKKKVGKLNGKGADNLFSPAPKKTTSNYDIQFSQEYEPSGRSHFMLRKGKVSTMMTSRTNSLEKKYNVLASFFFRIVARTPYDEDYIYTSENNYKSRNGKSYYYKTDPNTGKRVVVPYTPHVHMHRKDEVVARNDWRLTIFNTDGSVKQFTPLDFPVSYENVTDTSAYKTIAEIIKKSNMDSYGVRNFTDCIIKNENPYIDLLEFGRYTKKEMIEAHKGPMRWHGTNNGYSVQAPRGILGITVAEFQDAEYAAMDKDRQVDVSDIKFNASVPVDANEILVNAMQSVDEFVNEKDILDSFMRGLPQIPLSDKSTREVKEKYRELYRKELEKEDERFMAELKREVERETKKEEALERKEAAKEKAQREWFVEAKKQRKYQAQKDKRTALREEWKAQQLKVKVETQKQKHIVELIKARPTRTLSDYITQSQERQVYGTVNYGGDIGELDVKIEKGKVYLAYHARSHNWMLAKDFFKSFGQEFDEKVFNKNIEHFFREVK